MFSEAKQEIGSIQIKESSESNIKYKIIETKLEITEIQSRIQTLDSFKSINQLNSHASI